MPKIEDVLREREKRLSPLQRKVLEYLESHEDEVYSRKTAKELAEKIGEPSKAWGVYIAMWKLERKGLISKAKVGNRGYYGCHKAIKELVSRLEGNREAA